MNITLVSQASSYRHLATKLKSQGNTVTMFPGTPITIDTNPKFVMADGISICRESYLHNLLSSFNIPYFFVNKESSEYENDKFLTKEMLISLGIPTASGFKINGKTLKENFHIYTKPYVIKLHEVYQYGRQTVIVNDDNCEEVYASLFTPSLYTIEDQTVLIVEEYIKLTNEYSYHALFNLSNWQYFGSGRDYKNMYEGDIGYNSLSFGTYSLQEVDPIVHEYTDKIYNYFKNKNLKYHGFIFINIGVRQDGIPIILEINTRSGDPELQVMVECIDNDLAELFYKASNNEYIPDIKFNGKQAVTVTLINQQYNWKVPPIDFPKLKDIPDNITFSLNGHRVIKYGVLTTVADTKENASKIIYDYLNNQYIGQYRYRKDVGIG
jgi:phosphoribosylamine-glycine ligase